MKSPGKLVPILVFMFGGACLSYAIKTFFHSRPPELALKRTLKAAPAPEAKPAPAPEKVAIRTEPVSYTPEWLVQQNDFAQRTANEFLSKAGLKMKLLDNVQYGTATDEKMEILMAASGAGRIGLYLFTTSQAKWGADKAKSYLEDFFKQDLKISISGKGSPYTTRNGVEMTTFKGKTGAGDEYNANYFKKGKHAHVLFMTDKSLSRHPAAVRDIVESIH